MKNFKIMFAVALIGAVLASCTAKEEVTASEGYAAAETAAITAPGQLYGAELDVTGSTPIADLYSDEFVGQKVRVEGTIVNVCAKRGCWIEIGAEGGDTVIFKVNDGEIVFPMKAKGSQVVAEGMWGKTVVSIEEQREEGAKHALENGEEFDPASVTEAQVYWRMSGIGARVDS